MGCKHEKPIARLEAWIGDQTHSTLGFGNESLVEETIDCFIRGSKDDSGSLEKSKYHVRLTSMKLKAAKRFQRFNDLANFEMVGKGLSLL